MKTIFENFRRSLEEVIEKEDVEKIKNLKPGDLVRVYHGTDFKHINDFINGFDATKEHWRLYNGPRHRGIFVTSDLDVAIRFASYGRVVFEFLVRAKNLHGVNYSGEIGREQEKDKENEAYLKRKFPNSFRPYLSYTMLQSNEPQALLTGLISPKNIKRIRIDQSMGKGGEKWYTREELLNSDLELGKEKIEKIDFDVSSPKIKLQDYLDWFSKKHNLSKERLIKGFKFMFSRSTGEEDVEKMFRNDIPGIGEKALKNLVAQLKEYMKIVS